jgi:hypothetical protein
VVPAAAASVTATVASVPTARFFAKSLHNTVAKYDPGFANLYTADAAPFATKAGIFAIGVLPKAIAITQLNPVSPLSSLTVAENVVATPVVVCIGVTDPTTGTVTSDEVDEVVVVVVVAGVCVVDESVVDAGIVPVSVVVVEPVAGVVEVSVVVVLFVVVPVAGVVVDAALTVIVTGFPFAEVPALSVHAANAVYTPAFLNV